MSDLSKRKANPQSQRNSVADPGCLSRILISVHHGSRISDPGSRISDPEPRISDSGSRIPDLGSKNSNKREGWKRFVVLLVVTKITKFLPKKLSLSSQKYRFGIRDQRSGQNLFQIPDPGVKKFQIRIRNTAKNQLYWTCREGRWVPRPRRRCGERTCRRPGTRGPAQGCTPPRWTGTAASSRHIRLKNTCMLVP